ncbi:MAG: hypothetical protein QM753_03270 [Thermomicrobiales bacterium]
MSQRLAVMEARQRTHWRRRRVDLRRLTNEDLDSLERLALDRQAWPGSLNGWLASLATDEHEELMRLHALARWS